MKYRRLIQVSEEDGGGWEQAGPSLPSSAQGDLFVDERGYVRFASHDVCNTWKGIGLFSPTTGYVVYDDGVRSHNSREALDEINSKAVGRKHA